MAGSACFVAGRFSRLTSSTSPHRIVSGGEQRPARPGLRARLRTSGRFFVNFTNPDGDTVVARFKRSRDPLVARSGDRDSTCVWPAGAARSSRQPFANHNGGNLVFGPDGFLYIGMGDGGRRRPGPPRAEPATLLGKMLRIDVERARRDPHGLRRAGRQPFVGGAGLRPRSGRRTAQSMALQLRRSARGGTGALVIGDVGQNRYEEIDYEPARPRRPQLRLAQPRRRARRLDVTSAGVPAADRSDLRVRPHRGQSITGGYVYRGSALGAAYVGRYSSPT